MLAIYTHSSVGFRGSLVTVEVDVRRGIPGTEIVGLPGSAVREARERVRVAVRRSGLEFPMDRILVNLSPAGVKKDGTNFDLAIAVAILCASQQLSLPDAIVLGELQLTGRVLPVSGVLSAVAEAAETNIDNAIVPARNAAEARAYGSTSVLPVSHLADLRAWFSEITANPERLFSDSVASTRGSGVTGSAARAVLAHSRLPDGAVDFASIHGQRRIKRALEVAAAGRHNLLLVGPPGSGKTMAANALPGVLPPLSREEALTTSRIHSLFGKLVPELPLITMPPFRAPHHTASREGVIGGGKLARPGEVSLAHNGVLFLDEAPEFRKHVLQSLREPVEDRVVRVVRADGSYRYPADFQLVLAANPCPCGLAGDPARVCLCSGNAIEAYWQRLGGPLLDRVDLRVSVRSESPESGSRTRPETSIAVRSRVEAARRLQFERYREIPNGLNGRVSAAVFELASPLSSELASLLRRASEHIALSGRGQLSARRVAQTIADLEASPRVRPEHLLEAIQHRRNGEESLALLSSL